MIKLPQVLRLNVEDSCISKPLACRLSVRASTSDVQAVFFWGFDMENFDRLNYDPETGVFKWAVSGKCIAVGKMAGYTTPEGYLSIGYDNKLYLAHRLAWFITHGRWPDKQIDHINGNRSDNRIANLRDVSRSANSQNLRKAKSNNKIGLLGVSWGKRNKKWTALIFVNGKKISLGYFSDPLDAHNAYLQAKRKHHTGCTI